ncbi:MAG: hypothetical protein AAF532_08260 [Planctomycetota bacterium]
MDATPLPDPPRTPWFRSGVTWLAVLGLAQLAIWGVVAGQSVAFAVDRPPLERPIPLVTALVVAAFGLYAVSWRVASRTRDRRSAVAVVFIVAVIARGVLVPTTPILEIDIYRYMWDGRVLAEGVSPYRFSPQQVKDASVPSGDDRLDTLVALRERSPEVGTVLGRIHYAPIATVYPPVSQAVFAAAAWTTPEDAAVGVQLAAMKAWLVLFDVATIAAVAFLLRAAGRSPAECVAYAWCPLVLKEVANSGHLDAVAVAFTAWAAVFLVRGLRPPASLSRRGDKQDRWAAVFVSAALLALGVGAKLYPVVLLPVFAAVWWRVKGMPGVAVGGLVAGGLSAALLWPMLTPVRDRVAAEPPAAEPPVADAAPPAAAPQFFGDPPDAATPATPAVPEQGITAFLSRWEINDLAFSFFRDQLVVSERWAAHHRPWAVVTPRAFRERASAVLSDVTGETAYRAAFVVTRVVTLGVCGLVSLGCAACVLWRPTPTVVLRGLFLTTAWFVLLAPTVNPWYWPWALPFLPFIRGRVWAVISLAVMTYYWRLWLVDHGDGKTAADLLGYAAGEAPAWLDHAYQGSQIFDHMVVWLEWGPVFALLLAEWLWRDGRAMLRVIWMPPPLPTADDELA